MSAIEEISCHQVWQLGLPFMQACETAQPRGKVLIPLQDVYPDASDEDIVIISGIACKNGKCSSWDVLTFLHEGLQVGQLIVSVAGEDIVKIPTQSIDTVLVWALAPNEASCSIYMPPEIRPI